eukprot:scaffold1187_cov258-Pinguiococcus_pyrenoidosus.AAC.12
MALPDVPQGAAEVVRYCRVQVFGDKGCAEQRQEPTCTRVPFLRMGAFWVLLCCSVALRQAAGQAFISPPVLNYDSTMSDTAIAVFVQTENDTVIQYTLDGADPVSSSSALRIDSEKFIHVEASGMLRAVAVSQSFPNVASTEVPLIRDLRPKSPPSPPERASLTLRFGAQVRQGRFGRAILVPYHHSQPSYSGRVVEVDLDTTKYNSIRIHNVFTDLADYYSEVRLLRNDYEVARGSWTIRAVSGQREPRTAGDGALQMAEVFRAGDALHHAVTQVYVRDVAEGDPELVGFQRGFVYTSEVDGTAYGILVPFINGAQYSGATNVQPMGLTKLKARNAKRESRSRALRKRRFSQRFVDSLCRERHRPSHALRRGGSPLPC